MYRNRPAQVSGLVTRHPALNSPHQITACSAQCPLCHPLGWLWCHRARFLQGLHTPFVSPSVPQCPCRALVCMCYVMDVVGTNSQWGDRSTSHIHTFLSLHYLCTCNLHHIYLQLYYISYFITALYLHTYSYCKTYLLILIESLLHFICQ